MVNGFVDENSLRGWEDGVVSTVALPADEKTALENEILTAC